MDTHPLVLKAPSHLTDEEYRKKSCCLVVGLDATACDAFGYVERLEEKYSQMNFYKSRKRLYNLNRTTQDCRIKPGSLCLVPSSDMDPWIAGMVVQYAIGYPAEDNEMSKYYIRNSIDADFVEGLKKDTREERREYFAKALGQLTGFLKSRKNELRTVVFSVNGISSVKRGSRKQEFAEYYLPLIRRVAEDVLQDGIEVVLTSPSENYLRDIQLYSQYIKVMKEATEWDTDIEQDQVHTPKDQTTPDGGKQEDDEDVDVEEEEEEEEEEDEEEKTPDPNMGMAGGKKRSLECRDLRERKKQNKGTGH